MFSVSRLLFSAFIALGLLNPIADATAQSRPDRKHPPATTTDFDRTIADVRAAGAIPGITALAFRDGQLWVSAQGIRRLGQVDRVRLDDRFHLGSNIKSMTATAIAQLIERKRLRWDSTLGQLFPDIAMHPSYRQVTVEQLLQHRAGVIPLEGLAEIQSVPQFHGSPAMQRLAFARWALALQPNKSPGEFEYSNGGYAIAGAIIDRYAGVPYETALQRGLFKPLGIDAIFAWPASNGRSQPWGHADIDGSGALVPTDPADPRFQFPVWLRPAGDVSMNILDYAKYILLHAEAGCGRPRLLGASSFRRLHAIPASADGVAYSMGWSELDANGVRYAFHSGSAGNFFVTVAYDDRCRRGIAVFANSGTEAAGIAVETAVLDWMK